MGLFSTIGSFFGPMGTAIGSVGDAAFAIKGQRDAVKAANNAEANKYVRLRAAAEAGGFHPLEVLRAGGDVGYTPRPSLMTSVAGSNAFDLLENELTGEGAKQRKRQDVQDEIQERVLENMRFDIAQRQITRPTNVTNRVPRLPKPQDAAVQNENLDARSSQPWAATDTFTPPWLPSAQDAEDFGWEVGGALQGIGNMLATPGYNIALERIATFDGTTPREVHNKVAGMSGSDAKDYIAQRIKEINRANWGNPVSTERLRPMIGQQEINTKTRGVDRANPWER